MKRAFYVPVLAIVGFLLLTIQSNATEAYPSNWFVNMKYNQVQVLLRSTDADFSKATIAINYPGVKVVHWNAELRNFGRPGPAAAATRRAQLLVA